MFGLSLVEVTNVSFCIVKLLTGIQIRPEFYEMIREYEKRFEYAKRNTSLPKQPRLNKINEFVMDVNQRVVNGRIY